MNFSHLNKYLNGCIKKRKFPGAAIWVGSKNRVYYFEAFGYAQIVPEKRRMQKDTTFDLASLTKPLCTAMATMLLIEEKELRLNDPIEKYLKEFKNRPNGKRSIKELLTHTAGLPAWYPLYILPKEKRLDYLACENNGKKGVEYSCLGYIILFQMIEWITKQRFDEFCKDRIFKKLGLRKTVFNPSEKMKNIAPTEMGNAHEKEKAEVFGDISGVKWRDYLIKGEVHDGNCFYAYNGVSGNAGLFSNAEELAIIMRAYLNGEIVKMRSVKMMTKNHTAGREKRGLGWWVNPYPGILSTAAFGHTGFTGTMVLVDSKIDLIVILLTNSVHPMVRLGVMPKVRRKVIQIIADLIWINTHG